MNSNIKRGFFITLEGIEGAGKSTHIPFITDLIKKAGREIITTREPGGTVLGEKIRDILLSDGSLTINNDTELLLMFAARSQHLHEVIRPALADNKTVLCDRFTDSSYAYQSGGRKIDSEQIYQLVELVHSDLKPDMTLLFDLPVELGLSRVNERNNKTDRFESETTAFFQSVRDAYLTIADAEPERVKIIDAAADIESVQDEIKRLLEEQGAC